MAVKKREWTTPKGEQRVAWVAEAFHYEEKEGKRVQVRSIKTFRTKKAADAHAAQTKVHAAAGMHVPDSQSITVKEAAADWLAAAEELRLERSTQDQYRQHVELHIVPFIGALKLSRLTVKEVRAFESKLRAEGRSEAMVKKVLASLSSMISDAQERGNTAINAVRDMRSRRKSGKSVAREKRRRGKLEVGVDFPSRDEVRLIIQNAELGRWRTLS
jgi:hypothetical protein